MGSWEWSDVRCFLAVAKSGSTAAAARQLGMNQTTCARRIAALEHALGIELFERLPGGYALTDGARQLLESAGHMEQAAGAFEDGAAVLRRESGKVIRLTAVDALVDAIVLPAVARLQERFPAIRVELDISQRVLDLSRGEADVALRASGEPPTDPSLVARKLASLPICGYCSRDYAARTTIPRSLAELSAHPVVALEGAFAEWLRARGFGERLVQVVGTVPAVIAALRMGSGVALLPRIVAGSDPDLVHCFDVPDVDPKLWLIYPERLRGKPEIREFSRVVAEQVEAMVSARHRAAPDVPEQATSP